MEHIGNMLKSGSSILESKGHDAIRESSTGRCQGSFALIIFMDLNLIIHKELVHER
jgi:hypothetical protein